jgi:hypothetical protein
MLTLAIPQSEPTALTNVSASRTSVVNTQEDSPWGTSLWSTSACSKDEYFST